jgi:hypothetical protein
MYEGWDDRLQRRVAVKTIDDVRSGAFPVSRRGIPLRLCGFARDLTHLLLDGGSSCRLRPS